MKMINFALLQPTFMTSKIYLLSFIFTFCFWEANAHPDTSQIKKNDNTEIDSSKQKDMIDVLNKFFKKNANPEDRKTPPRLIVSLVPAAGYTLSTGFAVDLSASLAFYTQQNFKNNISFINFEAFYDTRAQKNFFTQSSIWADKERLRFVTDLRFLKYPDDTFGLGSFSTNMGDNPINYNYIRLYETAFRKILPALFIGGGYNLDYHYNITQSGTVNKTITDFQTYGFSNTSISSGVNLALLYDTRKNPINALGGTYANLIFRQNARFLGSDANWESIQLDFRKYYKFPANSNNVVAIWNMEWFNFNGNSPYMDLPSTGWDTFNNVGRGYVIGRFRSPGLIYLETEYRFGLTKNGLLGGVVFANGQSFSEYPSGGFKKIIPAIGSGLRVKINKHSNTNVCVDYAYGFDNSKGFFVNLGEMF